MVLPTILEAMPTRPILSPPISFTLYEFRCALLEGLGTISKFPMGRHGIEPQ